MKMLLMSIIFLGCVACQTSYQPQGFMGGFSEMRLSDTMYQVSFKGNGYTNSDVVSNYLLRRCAELTINSGFQYFVFVDGSSSVDSSLMSNTQGSSYSTGYGTSFNSSTSYTTINRHSKNATIVMFNPENRPIQSIDARRVASNFQVEHDSVKENYIDKYALDEDQNEKWKFSIGAGPSLGSTLTFGSITDNAGSGKGKAELNYSESLSLMFDFLFLPKNSWGFIGGLAYDAEKSLTDGEITSANGSVTNLNGSNPSKIQIIQLLGSAAYRWNEFYIPFGLNLSIVNFTPAPAFSGQSSADGGIGTQVGLGYYINERFAIEGLFKSSAVTLGMTSGSYSADYKEGYLNSTNVLLKYIF